jgi:hypothetical protein
MITKRHPRQNVCRGFSRKVFEGMTMNDAALQGFRMMADILAGGEPQNWQWNGPYMSQQYYGITETRAKEYAAKWGGTAKPMASQQ